MCITITTTTTAFGRRKRLYTYDGKGKNLHPSRIKSSPSSVQSAVCPHRSDNHSQT